MSKSLELSFEFFPPKTEELEEKMWVAIEQLAAFKPSFVSVTYGAGGTTRDNTHKIAKDILKRTKLQPAAHLTCARASKAEVDEVARMHWDAGIRHIVALRGDPPRDTAGYVPPEDSYQYATDLMRGLHDIGDFEISVAAFPEKHPESSSFEQDIEILRLKDDMGASRAITQYFFDDEFFLRLRDRTHKAKIRMPVIPGIIPINHFANIKRFSEMCGTSIPASVEKKFAPLDNDPKARNEAAIELATRQCEILIAEGINQFHFYTMNRADLITGIFANLGASSLKELA